MMARPSAVCLPRTELTHGAVTVRLWRTRLFEPDDGWGRRPEGWARVDAVAEVTCAARRERFGRLDILMNNVGGNLAPGRIAEVALKDWNANLDLNITAPFLCTQAALPLMREQRRGTIVNVASGAGRRPTVQTGSS